jgi:Cu/Ag efflux protein CusF
MKRGIATLMGIVVAGSLAWGSGVVAQTPPAAPAPAAAKQLEGTVKSVDATGKKLTLADGTEFMIPAGAKVSRAELKPGTAVKVSYEEQGGQKIVKGVEVK